MSEKQNASTSLAPRGPSRILDLSWGFARTASLVAALDLGVFTAIAHGYDTVDALSARLEADRRGTEVLLGGLGTLGLVTRADDGRYRLAEDAATYLVEDSRRYLGDLRHVHRDLNFVLWPQLADSVREGTPRKEIFAGRAADVWSRITPYLDALGEAAGEWIAGVAADLVPERARVLDAGCGYGGYGRALAEAWDADLVGLDREESVAAARERVAGTSAAGRSEYRVADLFGDEWGGPYDVVLLSNVAHGYERVDVERLLGSARRSLTDGGVLLIYEIVPDNLVDPVGAFFSLEMLLTSEGGAHRLADYTAWSAAAGMPVVRTLRSPTGPGTLVVASKGGES